MPRISPFSPSSVNPGRVQSPGTGHTHGPGATQPKSLERIGPLAPLMGRKSHAVEGDQRPRTEVPRSRDLGGGRSWLSSMKHAANKTGSAFSQGFNKTGSVLSHGFSKTGHALSHGFTKTGHALHKFGQALNEPNREPSWMSHMSDDERAHYDYYGELPAESSHSTHSSPQYAQPAPPWQQQDTRVEVQLRPMTDAEQAAENEAASYHGYEPRTQVEEYVSSPSSSPSRTSSGSSSAGSVRTRPMTPAEQAAENEQARYYGVEPRTSIEEVVTPSQPASPSHTAAASPAHTAAASRPRSSEVLRSNIRETVAGISMSRLDRATPREFIRFAQLACKGTRFEQSMANTIQRNPGLGGAMQERWHALREHLHNLQAQGHENVPTARWLLENRGSRMMEFLVNGNSGGKLVRPMTQR
jgi:hypothetical protein